jgi:DNA-directed RNA polymerase subunit H (RpoH/RPB5)
MLAKKGDVFKVKNTTTIKDTWTLYRVTGMMLHIAFGKSILCDTKPYLCDRVIEDIFDTTKHEKISEEEVNRILNGKGQKRRKS